MDKRIGYIHTGGPYGEDLCWCIETLQKCPHERACEHVAFVTPSDLAKVEEQAAREPALTEAVGTIYGVIKERICDFAGCDDCLTGLATRTFSPRCAYRHAIKAASAALSLTPASLKQHAEDARVGRAMQEWAKEMHDLAQDGGPIPSGRLLLQVLDKVIAQAKEGKPK